MGAEAGWTGAASATPALAAAAEADKVRSRGSMRVGSANIILAAAILAGGGCGSAGVVARPGEARRWASALSKGMPLLQHASWSRLTSPALLAERRRRLVAVGAARACLADEREASEPRRATLVASDDNDHDGRGDNVDGRDGNDTCSIGEREREREREREERGERKRKREGLCGCGTRHAGSMRTSAEAPRCATLSSSAPRVQERCCGVPAAAGRAKWDSGARARKRREETGAE
jgi:hypothetical protein